MRHILLLPCSRAKRHDAGDLPAFERYDGPLFRVLRKKAREEDRWPQIPPGLELLILSARYGLIYAATMIPDYDQPLPRRAPTAEDALIIREVVRRLGSRNRACVALWQIKSKGPRYMGWIAEALKGTEE